MGGAVIERTRPSNAHPLRITLVVRPHEGVGISYEMAAAMECRMSKSEGREHDVAQAGRIQTVLERPM
jgi:hypothetical protein